MADVRQAYLPAYCSMPSTRLVGGRGSASLAPHSWTLSATSVVFADLLGNGHRQALATVTCSPAEAGAHHDVQILVGPGGVLLGWFGYDKISHAESESVITVRVSGHVVSVHWSSANGCCSNITHRVTQLTFRAGQLVALTTQLSTFGGRPLSNACDGPEFQAVLAAADDQPVTGAGEQPYVSGEEGCADGYALVVPAAGADGAAGNYYFKQSPSGWVLLGDAGGGAVDGTRFGVPAATNRKLLSLAIAHYSALSSPEHLPF